MDTYKNLASSRIVVAPSPALSGGSFTVTAGQGARFPTAAHYVAVKPRNQVPTLDNCEILRVTRSVDTFTVVGRAQGGSSARAIIAGDDIYQPFLQEDIASIVALIDAVADGDVVGPASAVTARIATFSGATGKLIQDGGSTIAGVLASALAAATSALLPVSLTSGVSGRLPFANLVALTADRLLGRVSSGGDAQEISLGSSLAFSGTALNTIQGIRTTDSPTFAGLTIGTSDYFITTALSTPVAPTITPQGSAGSTAYSYKVVALNEVGRTVGSSAGSTATGNATLTGSNFNRLSGYTVTGATAYQIFRSATAGTPSTVGLIGVTASATFDDTGLAGDTGLVANKYTVPTLNSTIGAGVTGQIKANSLYLVNSADSVPKILLELTEDGNPDNASIAWLDRFSSGPYQLQAYFDMAGNFATSVGINVSNKRTNTNGDFQGCASPWMISASPDVNGATIASESNSSLAAGFEKQCAFGAFDLGDISSGSGAYSVGFGKQKWAVLGDGSQLWGTFLNNTTFAANADVQLYRIAGGLVIANSTTKAVTGSLSVKNLILGNVNANISGHSGGITRVGTGAFDSNDGTVESGQFNLSSNGSGGIFGSGFVNLRGDCAIKWGQTADDAGSTKDLSISRISAGRLGIGTGAAASVAGTLNVGQGATGAGNLALQFGTGGEGFYAVTASGSIIAVAGGSKVAIEGDGVNFGALVAGFSTIATSSKDTGLSRISAGLLGVGTGAAASFAGGLKMTALTTVGVVIHTNLPTSASGLATGQLWNNGGVVNVA